MANRIASVDIVDGELIVTYQDGSTESLGPVPNLDPEELSAAVQRNAGDIAGLKRDVAALQEAVAGLGTSVETAEDDIDDLQEDVAELKNDLSEKADKTEALSAYIVETETGSIASFTDGAYGVPVKDLSVAIEPVQSGSGDPSPENVRPISGWTGANVTACGINVWDEQWEIGAYDNSDGTKMNDYSRMRCKDKIQCVPNTAYFYSCNTGAYTGNLTILFYDADENYISYYDFNHDHLFTTPNNCHYITFYTGTAYGTTYNHDISINYPATDTTYHPYNGSSVSIDWTTEAGTVYGGTLDVTTGVLTVDRANIASYNGETLSSTWISDRDVYASGATPTTGAQVVYELATPQTYQLTPQEVSTILGQNNIFADTGNVTVQYRADTKLYIDKVLSA